MADCQYNPNMVINSIFPVSLRTFSIPLCSLWSLLFSFIGFSFSQVFDAFRARLQESNSKVNLYALESLQKIIHLLKDNLSQVVNILVPAIVDNHLNSKNNAIYSAAIGTLNALLVNLGTSLSSFTHIRESHRCLFGLMLHFLLRLQ